jgi:exodeoxyribonuclease VII small subunit
VPEPDSNQPPLSFEEALEQVERIVTSIESGEIGLERSIAEYERGMALLNRCRQLLQRAELKVDEVTSRMQEESLPEPPAQPGPGGAGEAPPF